MTLLFIIIIIIAYFIILVPYVLFTGWLVHRMLFVYDKIFHKPQSANDIMLKKQIKDAKKSAKKSVKI